MITTSNDTYESGRSFVITEKSVQIIINFIIQNKSLKDKENNEKLDDELSKLHNRVVEEERKCKQLQSQLTRSLESQEDISRREIEQSQNISQLVSDPCLMCNITRSYLLLNSRLNEVVSIKQA